MAGGREGSLEAPTRHALDWKDPEFYNEDKLLTEMELSRLSSLREPLSELPRAVRPGR